MHKRTDLRLKLEEARTGLLDLVDDENATEELLRSRTDEVRRLQAQLDALELAEPPVEDAPAHPAAPAELVRAASVDGYCRAAMNGKAPVGAEAELLDELGLKPFGKHGVRMPVALLGLTRADTATTAQTGTGASNQLTIVNEVFKGSVLDVLGISPMAVPVGQSEVWVVTSGATAEFKSESAAVEAAAMGFDVSALKPIRLTTRYKFTYEAEAQAGGALEQAMRENMAGAMLEDLEAAILTGTGTAPQPAGLTSISVTPTTAPTTAITWAGMATLASSWVDGRYARSENDVRLVIPPSLHSLMARTFATGHPTSGLEALRANSGAIGVSAHLPGEDSNLTKYLVKLGSRPGDELLAMWPAVELVRDNLSAADKGEVAITMISLYNYKTLRPAVYRHRQIKTS